MAKMVETNCYECLIKSKVLTPSPIRNCEIANCYLNKNSSLNNQDKEFTMLF